MSKLILPKIIGHRGAKDYAPENTLASIHTAADMGAEWVELDVKLTSDSEAIIFHDDDLYRCTGADGLVADTSFEEIRNKDAGTWFSDSFVGERIPTLEEAIEAIIERKLGLNLEIKPCPGREIETAEIALDIIGRIYDPEDVLPLISSFSHVSLETAKDEIPSLPRAILIDDYIENWKDLAEHLEVSAINFNAEKATLEQIEEYLDYGKPLIAYTVNDPLRAHELLNLGVTSVITDCPDIIMEEIESYH